MRAAAVLALRLVRLGGSRAALSAGLIGAGVVVGTILLTLALGGVHGWDAREARVGWRADLAGSAGGPAVADPVGWALAETRVVDGRAVPVVQLAATAAPPGLDRAPAPGEVWVSPGLAGVPLPDLPGPAGEIGAAGLRGPDELVAIVGRAPGDPALADATALAGYAPVPGGFGVIEVYRQLTHVAVALLVFPVAGLLGASARLTAARRTERLALLRLLGASTRQVTVAATAEVTVVATLAAVVGVALYWLGAPLAALIELDGGRWFADDVRPDPPVLAGIVAGVALLATAASVNGLRRVVVGPLGVARRSSPGGARWVRLAGVAAAVGAFAWLTSGAAGNVTGLVFGVAVLTMFGTVMLIGPLVVRVLGGAMVRSARTPAALLAGRRLLDDPKGAFRPLSGLVLAVFVAGFLAPLTAAVAGEVDGPGRYLVGDLQRGALVVLVGTFAIAATAAGTAAAARVLDQRRALRLLRLAGTPLSVLDAARRAETLRPLLVCGGIALVMGVVAASPFAAATDTLAPSGLVVLGATLVVGVLVVLGASAASRPLLRAVTTQTARED